MQFGADDGIVVGVWFIYILRCANGSLYVGETDDVSQRLADHNRGRGASHTAKHRPVQLAYVEQHPDRVASLARERQLKRWTHSKKVALISGAAITPPRPTVGWSALVPPDEDATRPDPKDSHLKSIKEAIDAEG